MQENQSEHSANATTRQFSQSSRPELVIFSQSGDILEFEKAFARFIRELEK